MFPGFSAREATLEVIDHLERARIPLCEDPGRTREAAQQALDRWGRAAEEGSLPVAYSRAIREEVLRVVPERWRSYALTFTAAERRSFGQWRGGDVLSRLCYVFAGLALGGLCVVAPFIPIWEKWFPFALSALAWFLPDLQAGLHRRRYARQLGEIVRDLEKAQPLFDRQMVMAELLDAPSPSSAPSPSPSPASASKAKGPSEE